MFRSAADFLSAPLPDEGTARETRRRLEKAGLLSDGPGEVLITESLEDPQRLELAWRLLRG